MFLLNAPRFCKSKKKKKEEEEEDQHEITNFKDRSFLYAVKKQLTGVWFLRNSFVY